MTLTRTPTAGSNDITSQTFNIVVTAPAYFITPSSMTDSQTYYI